MSVPSQCNLNNLTFTQRNTGYEINAVTTTSSSVNEAFVSRMFSPMMISNGEDQVCGAAHCVMGPYWYQKQGVPSGKSVQARQVSPRGGDLILSWDEEAKCMKLFGESTIIGVGDLCF